MTPVLKTKIGLVGYSRDNIDKVDARKKIRKILKKLIKGQDPAHFELVSGYTNTGIPKLGYEIADKLGIITVGFSAKEALTVDCGVYPVKKDIIMGEKFGDESWCFINYIDILVRIGGGKQSHKETVIFKKINEKKDLSEILFEEEVGLVEKVK